MEKIIAAIDGLKYSANTVDYSIYLAKETGAKLIGIFLEDFTYHSYKLTDILKEKEKFEKKIEKTDIRDNEMRQQSLKKFKAACKKANIEYSVHRDTSIALQELLHETIFADLLVIDKNETLNPYNDKLPTRFIREVLTSAKCPVFVVSGIPQPIKKILFLYDGEPSAVHAIKMFSYALPLKQDFNLHVISVREKSHREPPDSQLIKEYLALRFPHASYTIKYGVPEVQISKELQKMESDTLVILGAYERGRFSRWFRESMADVLMKETSTPLFIAHEK